MVDINLKRIASIVITGILTVAGATHEIIGQVEQPLRYEVELEWGEEYYNVIPAAGYGVALIRRNDEKYEKGKTAWEIVMLDTTLTKRWTEDIYIDYEYDLIGYDNIRNRLFFLFQFDPNRASEDIIVEIDIPSARYNTYEIKRTFNLQLTEFEIVNNSAILGGYVNTRPTVMQYFFREGTTKVLPGFYFDRSRLLDLEVNDTTGIFTIITSIRTFDKKNTIAVRKFTSEGEMIDNYNLEPREKTSLVDARNISINSNVDILAGTYSNRNIKYTRGIFLAYIDQNGNQDINYFNYADLNNFFNYMKARRQKRIEKRIKRRKIKGKKLRFNYRLLVHDIIPYKDNFILLGEAYYPKYNNYNTYGGIYSYYPDRSYYRNYYFEGYRYTHAVVIGFDHQGNLLWDNSFEINDVMSYNLKQFVHADPRKNEIVLLYNYENVIRSKIIREDEVIEGKSFNDILLKFQDDEVRNNDSEYGGLEKWYDNRFYAYGIQKIKNLRDKGVKLNRRVFFINKIIYN